MSTLFERAQQSLLKRRENLLNGNVNSIPSPFVRFRNDFIGLERGQYILCTSFTKGKLLIDLNIFSQCIV